MNGVLLIDPVTKIALAQYGLASKSLRHALPLCSQTSTLLATSGMSLEAGPNKTNPIRHE
jgi:hypothetical protein